MVSTIARADLALIRARPRLVEQKYRAMSASLVAYLRGSIAVYSTDFFDGTLAQSEQASADELVLSVGDAHPENFGVLADRTGKLALEPNDLDGADALPFLYDLRRLLVGFMIAAGESNADDPGARLAARGARERIGGACIDGYLAGLDAYAAGAAPERIVGSDATPLADLFARGAKDLKSRDELASLTVVGEHGRELIRGTIDPQDPEQKLLDVTEEVRVTLPAVIESYRRELVAAPAPEFFALKDVAREVGSGVASLPRVRLLVLVEGPSLANEDDVVLELKELGETANRGGVLPGPFFGDPSERVRFMSRHVFAEEDSEPLWGTAAWLGFFVQLRKESEAHKTLRIARLTGDKGTPEAIAASCQVIGRLLARVHATPWSFADAPAHRILDVIADRAAFRDEEIRVALGYALTVEHDYELFANAFAARGPTLGVPVDAEDTPKPSLALLLRGLE